MTSPRGWNAISRRNRLGNPERDAAERESGRQNELKQLQSGALDPLNELKILTVLPTRRYGLRWGDVIPAAVKKDPAQAVEIIGKQLEERRAYLKGIDPERNRKFHSEVSSEVHSLESALRDVKALVIRTDTAGKVLKAIDRYSQG